ncbi:hypothetical protein H5410_030246 [Solanum commersonii]|uniref:MULE transposase domain-containing protein n=1 Tax=Solanum commersonii TaxID=4109 RepID=A0A9J5YI35_SOLCO|nr:hypothetical protein H5410_030246 [Solanum commersonii]
MLNDEFDIVDMNNHDDEIGKDKVPNFESNNPLTPIVAATIQLFLNHHNKEELANSLKIACLKKDFRLKKVSTLKIGFPMVKSHPQERCQFNSALNWVVRGTHEHGYAVLNAYRYMLEVANPGSKTTLLLDENGRFNIRKMVLTIYPASHYGCCIRHLGESIRNSFHNSKVVSHFYKAAKAYDRCEFNDHFNQIRDLVPKTAESLQRTLLFIPSHLSLLYNIMTSNIAGSVNVMFNVGREFPIVALFDEINKRFALLFH